VNTSLPRSILTGAVIATIGAFPMAALVALVYRFPIPFAGEESGIKAAIVSPFAVVFYGLLGGFLVLPCLGAVAGFLAHRIAEPDRKSIFRWTVRFALVADLIAALFLALLDKIIGPW
jgi:hypothetical protein